MDCSLREDTRDCTAQVDNRDCSAGEDSRDCSQPHDERSCSTCIIHNPFGGCIQYGNDPFCEGAKAAQNKIYEGNKLACEAAKAGQNAGYATAKASCEASKAAQNSIYKANMAPCEAGKAAQNAAYAHVKLHVKRPKRAANTHARLIRRLQAACLASNIFNGDLFGPAGVNLFMRALNHNPGYPTLLMTPSVVQGGIAGDALLLAGTHLRVGESYDRITLVMI